MPVFLVRHAKSKNRERWEDDDALRPLTRAGRAQAEALVGVLKTFSLQHVYSSPFLRCVQTIEPLARARTLSIETTPALAEGAGLEAAMDLMRQHDDSVYCTHGDIVVEMLDQLIADGVIDGSRAGMAAKGSTWIGTLRNGRIDRALYLPPP